MSEAPSLLSLSEAAQAKYPKAPAAMAVLAHASPESLTGSLEQSTEDDVALKELANSANTMYEIASRRAQSSHPSLDLPLPAQIAHDVENLRADYQGSVKLAAEVSTLRIELARRMRVFTTFLVGLEFVGIGEALASYAAQEGLPAEYVGRGVAFGMIGAGVGFFASKARIDTAAKKRARKIATRMNTTEELSVYFPPGEETEENKVGTVITTGSETGGKIIESTFLDRTYKAPEEVRGGFFLDRRARRAARHIVRDMDYSANAQLRYPTSSEKRDALLA
jgi:hypothetical protein